ncbi:CDN_1a_G0000800.mRNA.1.CDS.1 [Saccharomyces cerevisiae]|nr:CPI_1c_G0000850.mRNA.1.CDS.1 [Saccharomyces cerevisiae]CAI4241622.1 CPA_1a_G0000870.mRNA.1.CDS.1 [Saccharomyces cerevisiae]CAI4243177.1 CDN_1a_G0000800.mRNA.1.CDS.1 [Saccharomyces cerevisiae]CAI4243403.1 BBM_1a_G0000830.mRNA.1.CDS.1 [Saccharomyces cerevisiae]CAI4522042.1 CPA_1a_G0025630.mRNA.1.CDS.1 [Saccharomyces cerevisiae]
MLIDSCYCYVKGTHGRERLLSQGLLSATPPRNTNAVRVAVRLGSRALQGQKRNISRPRRNNALSFSRFLEIS